MKSIVVGIMISKIISYYNIGNIIGFTNLGEVNSHLEQLDKSADNNNDSQLTLANSMLVMMVKGLFSKLHFPLAQFPCTALAGDQIFEPFWEAVSRLEFCGFKVLALTCDGLAANRRLFRLHNPKNHSLVNKVRNPYAPDRHIFFLIDPPHLLKTVCNGWANKKHRLWG